MMDSLTPWRAFSEIAHVGVVEGDVGPLTKKCSLGRTQYEGGTAHMVGKVGALQKL